MNASPHEAANPSSASDTHSASIRASSHARIPPPHVPLHPQHPFRRHPIAISSTSAVAGTTPNGTYALIDYVNFKGDGTLATERYQGQGWGLLQVLAGMREVPAGQAAAAEFAASAKRMLSRRVANAPAERGESRWLPGWHNRCATYAKPL
jgi:hypothetical protein